MSWSFSVPGEILCRTETFFSHVQGLSTRGSRAKGSDLVGLSVGFACVKKKGDWKWGKERIERKAEFQTLSKHPGSWKQGLAKRKRTNINQYRCYFQASERVFQSRFLAQESDPCPVAAVFYVPNPPLKFSILAKTLHTSALALWNSDETAAGYTMPGNSFFNFSLSQ